MVGWLVSLFSKEPYYANYERNLEKIAQEVKDLEELRRQREDRKSTLVSSFWQYGLIIWAGSIGYAFWIQQLEEGVLSPQQHALRVSPALFLLPLLFVMNFVLNTLLSMGDKRNQARLIRLQRSKKKTIQDLKEYTKFDKVLTIIKQHDPENVPRMVVPSKNQQPQKNSGKSQGNNVMKQNGMHQEGKNQQGKSAPVQQSESGHSRLLPLFDRFANFMGDNPGLLAELSHLKRALYEAQDRARSAEEEVMRLKQEIAILKGEQEDLQLDGLIDTLDNEEEQPAQQPESNENYQENVVQEAKNTDAPIQENSNKIFSKSQDFDVVEKITDVDLPTQENGGDVQLQKQIQSSDTVGTNEKKNSGDVIGSALESFSTAQEQSIDNEQL